MHKTRDNMRSSLHLYDTICQHREALDTAALIYRCEKVAGGMDTDIQGRLDTDEKK